MPDVPHFTFLQAERRVLNPKFARLLGTILVAYASHTEISSSQVALFSMASGICLKGGYRSSRATMIRAKCSISNAFRMFQGPYLRM